MTWNQVIQMSPSEGEKWYPEARPVENKDTGLWADKYLIEDSFAQIDS